MASDRALYVVSDVHGHLDKLASALETAGLIDGERQWTGGDARLWFLGDLFDRGADGSGIVELIMRLGEEAEAEGGVVDSLMGNHEVLMLGAQRFGTEELSDDEGNSRNFDLWWRLNGGQDEDVAKLTDRQLTWLRNRPAITYVDDHLLVHTDTTEYASYGRNINAVNRAVRKIVKSSDAAKWWALFRKLTIRHRFEAGDGPEQAAAMLDFFGGSQLVHGHSTIPDRLGIPGDQVTGARRYCDDLVLCVDGGVYQGGPCLVV
ncbi:MAG: metallophosphoesterase, partial [Stackebrandtia sp.]